MNTNMTGLRLFSKILVSKCFMDESSLIIRSTKYDVPNVKAQIKTFYFHPPHLFMGGGGGEKTKTFYFHDRL